MVIDTDQIAGLFQNWGLVQWAIAAVMAFLVGTSAQVKWLAGKAWNKLWGLIGSGIDDFPPPSPEVVDDMPILIHQMRLCVCDEVPSVRDGCNKHLDEIEQLISGTEVETQ